MHIFIFMLYLFVNKVTGHARLVEPPSRASMWRFGYNTPPDYQDNEGFCGGQTVQWTQNGGKCGLCGDAYNGVREHEYGGKYATGQIVGHYYSGSLLNIAIDVTANHGGYFTFRLCPVSIIGGDPTQECLDQNELTVLHTNSKIFPIVEERNGYYNMTLQLPHGLHCDHCLLQWTYTCGNNWGKCPDGKGRVGCGPQETFRACADISILPKKQSFNSDINFVPSPVDLTDTSHNYPSDFLPSPPDDSKIETKGTVQPQSNFIGQTFTAVPEDVHKNNKMIYPTKSLPIIDHSVLPSIPKHIKRKKVVRVKIRPKGQAPIFIDPLNTLPYEQNKINSAILNVVNSLKTCVAIGSYKSVPGMSKWCNENCNHTPRNCPQTHCQCF